MKRKTNGKRTNARYGWEQTRLTREEKRDVEGFIRTKNRLLCESRPSLDDLATKLTMSSDQINMALAMRGNLERAIGNLDSELIHTGWEWDAEHNQWTYTPQEPGAPLETYTLSGPGAPADADSREGEHA